MNQIEIVDAIPDDVYEIRVVQKTTWLATYPNSDLGITEQDITSRFAEDETPEGKRRMEERKHRFFNPKMHTWVVKDGKKIVGFCIAEHEQTQGRIGAIYLLPQYQGLGVGRKLMGIALHWLENDGDVYVNVVSYNKQAISFYERFGFEKTGKEVTEAVAVLPSGKTLPETEMLRTTFTNAKKL